MTFTSNETIKDIADKIEKATVYLDCWMTADKIEELKQYIPHYELILPPTMNNNGVVILSIKVKGTGDYLPSYAGNLDIINCAAIKVTKKLI